MLRCYFLQVSFRLNCDFKNAHNSVQELPSVVATDVAISVTSQSLNQAQTVGNENQTVACACSRPALMSKPNEQDTLRAGMTNGIINAWSPRP